MAEISRLFIHDGPREIGILLPQTRAGLEELMDGLISRTNGLKHASFFEYEHTRDIGVLGQELSQFLRQHGKLHSITISDNVNY